jgi:hypothetical protein
VADKEEAGYRIEFNVVVTMSNCIDGKKKDGKGRNQQVQYCTILLLYYSN